MFFTFPEDARWNADRQTVEFGVEIGKYGGVVRVPRLVFQRLLPERPTPERCIEPHSLQRTRFESIAGRKLRRRQLTEDGNVEISGCDLDWYNKRSLDFRRPKSGLDPLRSLRPAYEIEPPCIHRAPARRIRVSPPACARPICWYTRRRRYPVLASCPGGRSGRQLACRLGCVETQYLAG
jgi:hypothetical protein